MLSIIPVLSVDVSHCGHMWCPLVHNQIGYNKIREPRNIYRFLRDKTSYHEIMRRLKATTMSDRSEIWKASRWPRRYSLMEIHGIWRHIHFLKWISGTFIDDESVLATNNHKQFIFHIARVLWLISYGNFINCLFRGCSHFIPCLIGGSVPLCDVIRN